MPAFVEKYTPEQRSAVVRASLEDGMTYTAIARAAHEGRLHGLDAFPMPLSYIGELVRKEKHRRRGKHPAAIANKPHRDAVEEFRQRLVGILDSMVRAEEKIARRQPEKLDPERNRQIARAIREVAALPGPNSERPRALGEKDEQQRRTEGMVRGALAGSIIAAARRDETATDTPLNTDTNTETTASETLANADRSNDTLRETPGSAAGSEDASGYASCSVGQG